MDLHIGFVSAIGRHLPKAVRVADRYHVARLAQDAFDRAHVEARKRLATGARLAMFRQRGLLAERRRALSEARRAQVDDVLAPFPMLRAAYEAKETFLEIYEAATRQDAERRLAAWLDSLPAELTGYFRALTSAVSSNREIILNYFSHRYTNAFTEAANGISKLMQRMGRGYGFEVMKVKLLYGKRAQSLDLTDFDSDPAEASTWKFMTRVTADATRGRKSQQKAPGRRGPSFERVARLTDEGYYDPGNRAIANELEPLIAAFARQA